MSMAEESPTFSTVRMREGYDIGEVDEFLDQARAALGRAGAQGGEVIGDLAPLVEGGDATARPAGLQAVGG